MATQSTTNRIYCFRNRLKTGRVMLCPCCGCMERRHAYVLPALASCHLLILFHLP